jgi:hypothetical protein
MPLGAQQGPRRLVLSAANQTIPTGQTQGLTVKAAFFRGQQSAAPFNGKVRWISSDNTVATVATGVVSANASNTGTVKITAVSGPASGSILLAVVPNAPLTGLAISPKPPNPVAAGTPQQFHAIANYSGTTQDVTPFATWTSSDHSIATVNISGVASTLGAGSSTITASFGGFSDSTALRVTSAIFTLPSDRATLWQPGVTYNGGIPNRTTICATLSPSGSDDSSAIQAALDACPVGQVVQLNAGTFHIDNSYLLINKGVTLRGAGADQTTLRMNTGAALDVLQAAGYTGDGVTKTFAFGLRTLAASWNQVQVKNVTVSNYTVSLNANQDSNPGGTITFSSAPANGASISIQRTGNAPFVQQPIIIIGPTRWPVEGASTNLTADGTKGSYGVTVASAAGLAVGDIVLIDELIDPNMFFYDPGDIPAGYTWFMRSQRPMQEWKEITKISGNTVTFITPLHATYQVSQTAQLTTMVDKHVKGASVENLRLWGGSEGNLELQTAAYSWVKNVESTFWSGVGVAMEQCFRCELRDSYLHDGEWPYPGGGGYAMSFQTGTSDSLIENNISITTIVNTASTPTLYGVNKVMVSRAAGAGSVVGYNYLDNGIIGYDLGWMEVGLNGSHMVGSHHTLFEGNLAFNADGDRTHGNQIDHTFFRNWLTGRRSSYSDASNLRCAAMAKGNWWMTFVGNVLGIGGDSAWSGTYTNYENNTAPWNDNSVWKLGYDDSNWNYAGDPKVLSTLIRDGNYDFLTKTQHWQDPVATLPNSFYMQGKPAFFGANPWPWVDPGTGATYTLPAKARFDAGTPNTVP